MSSRPFPASLATSTTRRSISRSGPASSNGYPASCPGSATTLESKDAVNSAVNVFYQDGSVPPEMTRLYKTHLGRIYEKTGAVRQADLVKLVAGFAIPQIS